MVSSQSPGSDKPTETLFDKIKIEIEQAAIDHINAKDAQTALSHFTEDAIAASNTKLFPSIEALSEDTTAYYSILKEVNLAVLDEMHINVINADTALVTAAFRYSFTDVSNEKTDLKGIWTALYVRRGGEWKIRVRHESFSSLDDC